MADTPEKPPVTTVTEAGLPDIGPPATTTAATEPLDHPQFPDDWAIERVSVEELERRYAPQPDDARAREAPDLLRPFGFMNRDWEALKAKMQPGDELVMFASPPESWRMLCGRAGVALMRGGRVVDEIVTVMN